VPTVSRFRGITIEMFFNEGFHPGRPHFHAEYAGRSAAFTIDGLELLSGDLPLRIKRLVRVWAQAHRDELFDNWERARNHQPLHAIAPLRN
jgi:hypothetical protein